MKSRLFGMWMRVLGMWQREEGQDLAEYGLVIALIAVVAVVALTTLGGGIAAKLTELAGSI